MLYNVFTAYFIKIGVAEAAVHALLQQLCSNFNRQIKATSFTQLLKLNCSSLFSIYLRSDYREVDNVSFRIASFRDNTFFRLFSFGFISSSAIVYFTCE